MFTSMMITKVGSHPARLLCDGFANMFWRVSILLLLASDMNVMKSKCFGLFFQQCSRPEGFSPNIPIQQEDYENWGKTLSVRNLWTATPQNVVQFMSLINWAAENGYKIRPKGKAHTWAPITVSQDTNCSDTILIKTDALTYMKMFPNGTEGSTNPLVRVDTGVTIEELLTFTEEAGYTLSVHPEIGKVTVGGVLAIGGHGYGISPDGQSYSPGNTHGSMSNLIESMQIMAWNESAQSYTLQTFNRSNNETLAFLNHLGRTFVVSVMLRVKPNVNLRCQSSTDVKIKELFAPPGESSDVKTFAKLHEATSKLTAIYFPHMEEAWVLKISQEPNKPPESRLTTTPYNYPGLQTPVPTFFRYLFTYFETATYWFSPIVVWFTYAFIRISIVLTNATDIWGSSKNILLYVDTSTILEEDSGYVIATKKENLQLVVSTVMGQYTSMVSDYQKKGMFPMNGPVQIRVSDLDKATNGDFPAYLSTNRYKNDYPEFNIAIWFDLSTAPLTFGRSQFFKELEHFILSTYNGSIGVAHPEWPKSWAYTNEGAFTNMDVLDKEVPNRIGDTWKSAICTFKKYDPKNIYSNEFMDKFLVTTACS